MVAFVTGERLQYCMEVAMNGRLRTKDQEALGMLVRLAVQQRLLKYDTQGTVDRIAAILGTNSEPVVHALAALTEGLTVRNARELSADDLLRVLNQRAEAAHA